MLKRFPSLTNLSPLPGDRGPLRRAKTVYLRAEHPDGSQLYWIEEQWLGKRYAYPCAIAAGKLLLVYWQGDVERTNELALHWEQFLPELQSGTFQIQQMLRKDFLAQLERFRSTEAQAP